MIGKIVCESVLSGVAELILLRGQIALIDDEDAQKVTGYNWYLGTNGYVMAWVPGKRTAVYLHRFVMDAQPTEQIDHKFHNKLDNRKLELRRVSLHQQRGNSRGLLCRPKSSVFKGVFWHKVNQKWVAGIKVKIAERRRWRYLGSFENEADAALAYNSAAKVYFGAEYAFLNHV